MAVTAIPNTTLSAAIDGSQTVIALTSITNVVKDMNLVVRGEAMKVLSTPTVATAVSVVRGVGGTISAPQPILALVYFATPATWLSLRDYSQGVTGNSGTLPQYLIPGARAIDNAGNQFVMVNLTVGMFSGVTALISNDGNFTAKILAAGDQGSVGVTLEQGTSDELTWVQIYGACSYAQETGATSDVTSASIAQATSAASTPSVGLRVTSPSSTDQFPIFGMFVTGVGTSATTSATSSTGHAVPVWLNYPYVNSYAANIIAPTT